MTVPAVLGHAAAAGLQDVGLVLHFHPGDDPAAFYSLREEIDGARRTFPGRIFLGAEIDLTDDSGATSWANRLAPAVDYVLLAMGHTQMPWVRTDLDQAPAAFLIRQTEGLLKALRTVPVTAVAHPYIYGALYRQSPGLAYALRPHRIPRDLVGELARCLVDGGIPFEYHCRDLLIRPQNLGGEAFVSSYTEFLENLRGLGVRFIPGSDAHYLDQIGRSAHAPSWAQNSLPVLQDLHV
jgi:histidinol phosphatase-like PHP family hydrolase